MAGDWVEVGYYRVVETDCGVGGALLLLDGAFLAEGGVFLRLLLGGETKTGGTAAAAVIGGEGEEVFAGEAGGWAGAEIAVFAGGVAVSCY